MTQQQQQESWKAFLSRLFNFNLRIFVKFLSITIMSPSFAFIGLWNHKTSKRSFFYCLTTNTRYNYRKMKNATTTAACPWSRQHLQFSNVMLERRMVRKMWVQLIISPLDSWNGNFCLAVTWCDRKENCKCNWHVWPHDLILFHQQSSCRDRALTGEVYLVFFLVFFINKGLNLWPTNWGVSYDDNPIKSQHCKRRLDSST